MANSKIRLLSEVRRGADLPSRVHGEGLAKLAHEGLIEKIPGIADYDYRLTEKGRAHLLRQELIAEQRRLAAE